MKEFKLRKTNIILVYFIILMYLEIMFKVITGSPIFNISLLYITINSLMISFLLGFITSLFKKSINKILYYISLVIFGGIFSLEFCCFKIFSFYFDWSLLGATDQVMSFTGDMIVLVLENILGVMIIFFPFIVSLSIRRYIAIHKSSMLKKIVCLVGTICCFIVFLLTLSIGKTEEYSAYSLYNDINNVELSIKKFGVVRGFFIDAKRNIFGFNEKINLDSPNISSDDEDNETSVSYEYNNLDIDFDKLIQEEKDEIITDMHKFFQNEVGTKQNEYTGFFEGKNLILFMAESFNEIAVDKDRTPTLYKLINNGFVFKDFYTPTISSTIGGEFQELTGLVAGSGFLGPWKSGENAFPFGIANMFKNAGYSTFAYHNHTYTFQNRNKYLAALGFDNYQGCNNGLEKKINCKLWPESDMEMITATVDDFISSEEPFFTYYVTVSGHGDYGWSSTAMGRKHREAVEGLPYSEKVLSYLAANIDLDKALEILINKLDEAGKLDDTVIALVGDHYPYMLSDEEVNEVSSYEKDGVVEINHSNFILWNNKMEPVIVEKIGSQIDVLPTIYNAFGLDYDSRLIIGNDILSTEPGLAVFGNRSWVSDLGTYFSSSGIFKPKDGAQVDEDYVKKMNRIVANKMNMSKLIMTTNYYKYFN